MLRRCGRKRSRRETRKRTQDELSSLKVLCLECRERAQGHFCACRARCAQAGTPLHLPIVPQNNGTQSCVLISKMGLCFGIKPHSRLNLSANAASGVQMSRPLPISDYVMLEADMVPLCRATWLGTVWMSGHWSGTGAFSRPLP